MWIIFILTCGVPRQAGVGIEIGLLSVFPALQGNDMLRIARLAGYFIVVLMLTLCPSRIVDIVGKYLTPFLLVCLAVMIALAVLQPLGTPVTRRWIMFFSYAFLQGYQTGDVAVGIAIAGMFIASIKARDIQTGIYGTRLTLKAAVVAFVGLFIVYGGLLYLGATGSGLFDAKMGSDRLLNGLVHALTGNAGNMILGIGIFLACLTTTIGVGSTIANLTVDLSGGKIPFNYMMVFVCLFGMAEACIGVQGRYAMATIIGLFEGLMQLNESGITALPLDSLIQVYNCIPFASSGFAWVIPSVIGFIIGAVIVRVQGGNPYPMLSEDK